jgi:hypothetical protein
MSNYPPNNGNPPEYPPVPPTPPYNNPGPGYPPPNNPGYPPSGNPGPGYPPPNNPGYPPSGNPGTYPPPPPYPPYTDPNVGYNAAPGYNNYGLPPVNNQPLPLGEALRQLPGQYWRVITKPGAATFAMEMGKAAWNVIWVQLVILALFVALATGALFAVLVPNLIRYAASSASSSISGTNIDAVITLYQSLGVGGAIFAFFFTFVGFFIATGIYFLLAKLFGGRGTFLQYCYCFLLFSIPIIILSVASVFIPFIGLLIVLALGIYQIVLMVYMTMAVHRLPGGRATLAVLILPIVGTILSCVLGFVALSAIMHTMQQMQNSYNY